MRWWQHVVYVLLLVADVTASCDDIKLSGCECRHPYGKRYEILCQKSSLKEMPPKANKSLVDGFAIGNFSYNSLSIIPDFYFNIMRHFDSLDFTSNHITKISDLTFRGLESKMTTLNMSGNALSSVPHDTFKEYVRLKHLDLSGNAITSPCKIRTADLEQYYLANNAISSITDQCFSDSTEVTHLDLSGNWISRLDGAAFDNLDSLTTLELANNHLSDVGNGFNALTSLPNFKYLTLAGNKFVSISSVCKYVFPRLMHMDLGYNQIAEIDEYCFEFYPNLDDIVMLELNFEHNEISSLTRFVFYGLEERLERVRLNHNRIPSINMDTFKSLAALTNINLDNNRLTSLDFLREWQNNELVELSVANNDISDLHSKDFVHMSSLVRLSLDGNRLLYIQSDTFVGLPLLTHLSIRNNLITDLADHAFTGLASLRSLRLSGNALVTLKNCTFGELVTLEQFHFEDNLLSCDCDLLWLLKFITTVKNRGMMAGMEKPVLDDDICRYPEKWSGEHMQNKVSQLCRTGKSTACFGLRTIVDEWTDDLANMTYWWDDALGAKEIHITQVEVKSGEVVYSNETETAGTGTSPGRTLEGFTDGNIFKVCTTVILTDDRQQKSCAIWPTMIKKPTTPAPLIETTTPMGMHPGSQAAIALAVILIILIVLLVVIGVYLWKTKKYRHIVPERFTQKKSVKSSSRDSSSSIESPLPESNGKGANGKGDPLEFRSAQETDPMMTRPKYTEHNL